MKFLNEMALFVEVVKAQSFTQAGERLGIPKSTLSNKISELENYLGLKLLNRTTRKIELTESGQFYFQHALRWLTDIEETHQQLQDMYHKPSGKLRISLPVDFAYEFIAPHLPEFCRQYPDIDFDFDTTPRRVDLISEPFDLAIRVGKLPDSSLVSQQLVKIPRYLYASPAYLAQFGEPLHPNDLAQHQTLRLTVSSADGWLFEQTTQPSEPPVQVPLKNKFVMNTLGMVCRLTEQGMGVALLPEVIVRREVQAGKIQRIMAEWQSTPIPVYALTTHRLMPAKTQVFIQFFKEKLRQSV